MTNIKDLLNLFLLIIHHTTLRISFDKYNVYFQYFGKDKISKIVCR